MDERSRHLPIFTGRVQPTIFGTSELNFCVRNGNRWDLTVIDTGCSDLDLNNLSILFWKDVPSELNNNLRLQSEYKCFQPGQALDLLVHSC